MSDVFQPGNVVRLKSGGPLMTVEQVGATNISVVWFDGGNRGDGWFNAACLVKVEQFPETTPWTVKDVLLSKTGDNLTLGEHTVTITEVEPLGDHGAQTLTVTGYGESELARRTRLAVQHAAEKYCVGRDAVVVLDFVGLPNVYPCPCTQKVRLQLVRDLDGFAYARGRCTECNRVYVAVEPVA